MLSDKEIEKAKDELKIIWKETDFENSKRRVAIETLLQYVEELEADNYECNNIISDYIKEVKKQDKMIDEMIEFIVSSAVADDTVCSRIFCDSEGDCSYKKQKKCTKQYFEEKVEGK